MAPRASACSTNAVSTISPCAHAVAATQRIVAPTPNTCTHSLSMFLLPVSSIQRPPSPTQAVPPTPILLPAPEPHQRVLPAMHVGGQRVVPTPPTRLVFPPAG